MLGAGGIWWDRPKSIPMYLCSFDFDAKNHRTMVKPSLSPVLEACSPSSCITGWCYCLLVESQVEQLKLSVVVAPRVC